MRRRRWRGSRSARRRRPTAICIACPTSSIRTCGSKACRWARAAARAWTTWRPRDGDYDIKVRVGRGIDSDIPHFIGEQSLEISIDGERVHVFTLPATPGEDLNIERQVARAPGTGPPRRPRAVDANGDPIPRRGGAGAPQARRRLGDSRADQGRRARDSRHVPDEDRRRVRRDSAGRSSSRTSAAARPTTARRAKARRCARWRSWGRSIPAAPRPRRATSASSSAARRKPAEEAAVREDDSVEAGAARVSPAGHRRGHEGAAGLLQRGPRRRHVRRPASSWRCSASWSARRSCSAPSSSPPRPPRPSRAPTGSATSSWPRACRSSCGAASRTRSCSTWPTKGKLREPAILEQQTRRMLADPRSEAFTANFAGQWLSLRRLPDIVPDPFLFPDYGDTLALRVSDAKPSSSSTASSARIGRRLDLLTPTTRSSTSGWRSTTASPT